MEMKETIEYIGKKSENIGRYSSKMREAVKSIDSILENDFKQAGIIFTDDVIISTIVSPYGNTDYKMCITKADVHGDITVRAWGIFLVNTDDEFIESPKWIGHVSREILKDAIPRLPAFLKLYCKKLEEKESEYCNLLSAVEKMQSTIVEY